MKEYGLSPVRLRPQPVLQTDVIDEEGNLRAADIGITWENNETFLHGVRVVGPGPPQQTGMRPVMSTPHQPIGGRDRDSIPSTVRPPARPVMSTPYQPIGGRDRDCTTSTVRAPTPETIVVTPDVDAHIRRSPPEIRQGYRPAAPMQRFNNKSLN